MCVCAMSTRWGESQQQSQGMNQYHLQKQQRQAAEEAAEKTEHDDASRTSDVFQWMRDRQNAFRDFQSSLIFNNTSELPEQQLFTSQQPSSSQLLNQQQLTPFRLLRDRPVTASPPPQIAPIPPLAAAPDRKAAMLSTTRNSSQQEMAPKARVTYDEGKFQVIVNK